jgi:DNA-binding transcriptional LysR family regulator
MAQPTLGRQVSALEEELGVALFERTGRGLALTPTGLDLVEHVRAMGEAAGRVSLAASGHAEEIAGPICITASDLYSAFVLPSFVATLRRNQPGIEVEIVASNEVRDLRRREADIAIRNGRPSQPDLIARKVADHLGTFYASESYLAKLGHPTRAADFSKADFIGFDRNEMLMSQMNTMGFDLTARNFPVISGNHFVHWELAKRGVGIGVFPIRIGDPEPGLRRILPDLDPITYPVWLVAHRDLATSRRIRLVFDLLADALAQPDAPA